LSLICLEQRKAPKELSSFSFNQEESKIAGRGERRQILTSKGRRDFAYRRRVPMGEKFIIINSSRKERNRKEKEGGGGSHRNSVTQESSIPGKKYPLSSKKDPKKLGKGKK